MAVRNASAVQQTHPTSSSARAAARSGTKGHRNRKPNVQQSDQSAKTRCLHKPRKAQILDIGSVLNLSDQRCRQVTEIFDKDRFSEAERKRR
jgi:hypothetical protein